MRVKILRQASPVSEPYWQEFNYECQENQTVAGMLDELNYKDDLVDINGDPAPRIQWECSCLQGMCGACAMVINGRPALACEVFLRDIKGDTVVIEPLKKFATISDLVVDRGIIHQNLKKANVYIGEYEGADPKEYDHMYAGGKVPEMRAVSGSLSELQGRQYLLRRGVRQRLLSDRVAQQFTG